MTNYEKIKNMNEEELADFLDNEIPSPWTKCEIKCWLNENEFKSHLCVLWDNKFHYGNIGEKTDLTLPFNEPLFVGDMVELFDMTDNKNMGEYIVVKNKEHAFVIGNKSTKFKNGIGNGYGTTWQIRKIKSYENLQYGEKIGITLVVLHE